MNRVIRDLLRRVEQQGWHATRTGGGHYKLVKPDRPPVFVSATPSDRRAILNIETMLRRADRLAERK